jgi:hypothetical protein
VLFIVHHQSSFKVEVKEVEINQWQSEHRIQPIDEAAERGVNFRKIGGAT